MAKYKRVLIKLSGEALGDHGIFEVEERSEEAACWQRFVEATSTK